MNNDSVGRMAGFLKRQWKKLSLSIVILFEVLAIVIAASYAWVETVSSIKITNENNTIGTFDTYVFTEATIGGKNGTIDLAKYFRQAGDMHLAFPRQISAPALFTEKETSAIRILLI